MRAFSGRIDRGIQIVDLSDEHLHGTAAYQGTSMCQPPLVVLVKRVALLFIRNGNQGVGAGRSRR